MEPPKGHYCSLHYWSLNIQYCNTAGTSPYSFESDWATLTRFLEALAVAEVDRGAAGDLEVVVEMTMAAHLPGLEHIQVERV